MNTKKTFNIRNVLAVLTLLAYVTIIVLGFFVVVPEQNQKFIERSVDQFMVLGLAAVIMYFFGNSKDGVESQKHKQEMEKLKVTQAITPEMKDALKLLNYTDDDITALTFQEASDIITNKTPKPE